VRVPDGGGVFLGISIIYAVDSTGFEDDVRPELSGGLRGSGIRGMKWAPQATGKDDDPPCLEMMGNLHVAELLGDVGHGQGIGQPDIVVVAGESFPECQTIDGCSGHAHVVGDSAIDTRILGIAAANDVPAADDDTHLALGRLDGIVDIGAEHHSAGEADWFFRTGKKLARKLENYTLVQGGTSLVINGQSGDILPREGEEKDSFGGGELTYVIGSRTIVVTHYIWR